MARFNNIPGYYNGFPWPIPETANGALIRPWDGSSTANTGAETGYKTVASGSSEEYIPVYGPGTRYPAGFTFSEFVELFYRVKIIKFTGKMSHVYLTSIFHPSPQPSEYVFTDFSFSLPLVCGNYTWVAGQAGGPPVYTDFNDSGLHDACDKTGAAVKLLQPSWVTSAHCNICPTTDGRFCNSTGPFPGNPPATTSSKNFAVGELDAYATATQSNTDSGSYQGLSVDAKVSFDRTLKGSDGLYYPKIELYFLTFKPNESGGVQYRSLDAGGEVAANSQVTFLGKSIPVGGNPGGGYYGDGATFDGAFTIAKYWSYDGLWDETTGARIG